MCCNLRTDNWPSRNRHGTVEASSSIYQQRIWDGLISSAAGISVPSQDFSLVSMKPIADHYQVVLWRWVFFPRRMHDQTSPEPVSSLNVGMAVPPEGAVLIVANSEIVDKVLAWWYRTLCDSHSTIHQVLVFHPKTVPVQRNTLFFKAITDLQHKPVTGSCLDGWPRELICSVELDTRYECSIETYR